MDLFKNVDQQRLPTGFKFMIYPHLLSLSQLFFWHVGVVYEDVYDVDLARLHFHLQFKTNISKLGF